jgi:hypothetical protein
MIRLAHLQPSLSRPSDWKTTTGWCTSMLIQNMVSVVVFELHRTCSRSLSGCIGHGFPLVIGAFACVIIVNPLHVKLPRLVLSLSCTCNCFDSEWVKE